MLKKIGKAIEGLNWLVYFSGITALVLLALYVGDVTRRINDVSMVFCAEQIRKESTLITWEQDLKLQLQDIIEREGEVEKVMKQNKILKDKCDKKESHEK